MRTPSPSRALAASPRVIATSGLLAVLTAATLAVGCSSEPREPGQAVASQPEALTNPAGFVEEFDGASLDARRWGLCHWWSDVGCTIASNDELQWYLPEGVRVDRGVLRLTAERRTVIGEERQSFPYVSGMISSGPLEGEDEARFAFLYGRAEVRARVPRGRGLWSAFWLLPADRESKPEIDVVEILGGTPRTARMHLHWRERDGSATADGVNWVGPDLSEGWHTYAIDWRPGVLVWRIDGVERWRVEGAAVPAEPMYLVANLAVGGWAGVPDQSTRFPSALEIDRVEVQPL